MDPNNRAFERKTSRRHSYWNKSGGQARGYRAEFGSHTDVSRNEKIWELMSQYIGADKEEVQKHIVKHIEHTLAKTRFDFTSFHCYQAVATSVRDRLIESFNDTQQYFLHNDVKFVYYLSLEFLIGRYLQNALINLDLEDVYRDAVDGLGYKLEALYEEERDPALGNGGLGRLAACFMDSLATLNYPAWGYGLRYSYGIFQQLIKDGYQYEAPDFWLDQGNPWEVERFDLNFKVQFYGQVKKTYQNGKEVSVWEAGESVLARPYDNPIPGYGTFNTINLRLWRSCPANEFDFQKFNSGDYQKALEERQRAEYITSVLYPNDETEGGKELRLKQQYLLVSATCQDVIRRFMKKRPRDWKEWPEKVAMQLNDTHPALAIVELLRILVDIEQFTWDYSWNIVYKCFAYTNHTVLPEALEKWGVDLLGRLLPRHLELIYIINHLFLENISKRFPEDHKKLNKMSIIEEGAIQKVRMANLCVIGSHAINGVAALHSQLIKDNLFNDFYSIKPNKFQNKTNGVTPRRWIRCCNPKLAEFYSLKLGSDDWLFNMKELQELKELADDKSAQAEFAAIKKHNKEQLWWWVKSNLGIDLNIDSLFDVQIKRLHEYKRQFMNILYVIHRYLNILDTPPEQRKRNFLPRSIMFGGKAAPGYTTAKRIIKLINSVAEKVNNDPAVGDLLKVVYLPNYNVSLAQIIIPATELSQHISTAGLEASGTSNMKFVMNGSAIIGTLDGANVEICEEVGIENEFIFGAEVQDIDELREKMRNTDPETYLGPELNRVIKAITDGMFGSNDDLVQLVNTIRYNNDYYLVGADFPSYIQAQTKVDETYRDKKKWNKLAMLNAFLSGKFSSDRTIAEYANEIWKVKPFEIPAPSLSVKERTQSFSEKQGLLSTEKQNKGK